MVMMTKAAKMTQRPCAVRWRQDGGYDVSGSGGMFKDSVDDGSRRE
jgi:hypothetical protein